MRKKMLLFALALTALATAIPAVHADSEDGGYCPQCITYSDGSRCCVSCWCDASGFPVACTQNYCPPEGEGGGGGLHD